MKAKGFLLITILSLFLLTACLGGEEVDEVDIMEEEAYSLEKVVGGHIILPLTSMDTLNPMISENFYYYHFSKLIYEGLFEFDQFLEPQALLVKEYSMVNNGKTIRIALRDDVKWHDGVNLSSADVKFTIDNIKANRDNTIYGRFLYDTLGLDHSSNLSDIIGVEIVDDLNLNINFSQNFSSIREALTFPILPAHRFQGGLMVADIEPIGTGPFKFLEYQRYRNIYLTRNENYWKGQVYIEKITGKVLEDEELILNSFETGQISLARAIDVDWDKYKQNDRINVLEYVSNRYEFLSFNLDLDIFQGEGGRNLRKALMYAIDIEDIINKVYLGHGTKVDIPIFPDYYLLDYGQGGYGYNRDFALEYFKEAGYEDLNGDGYLQGEDGQRLRLILTTNYGNIYREKTLEIIGKNFTDIGLEVEVKVEDRGEQSFDHLLTTINNRNFHIALLGSQTSLMPNPSYLLRANSPSNFSNFFNEELEELLNNKNLGSELEKRKLNNRMQDIILEELPYGSLLFRNEGILVDQKIVGPFYPNIYNMYNGLKDSFIVNR